ncbi:UvrD-helicase domain-containing protein [Peribacillus frigoritolerans]|uniref:UvrD-helicase domain-containing protein n=1 Tax=Peribacillus frigoritolerans TaxID=450367 RepID=UPI003F82C866
MDDDAYQEKFSEIFDLKKPRNYNKNNPRVNNKNPRIVISNDLSYSILSETNSFYRAAFNASIKTLFSWGIVTNQQCLELSKWYINKYGNKLKKAMSNRFEYVLLDEAQDTSCLQFEMLNYLFSNEKIAFQKFGDPYQALYNIFEGNEDAWVPTKQMEANYKEISETSRFGSSIANIVKNICVEEYNNFKSLNITDSFDPHYIIYNDEKDLFDKYMKLIKHYELKSESYFNSRKKDAILAPFHNDLINLFSVYAKPNSTTKEKSSQSPIKKIVYFLLDLLSKELDMSFIDIKKIIESNLNCKTMLSNCVKDFVNRELEVTFIIGLLEEILNELTNGQKNEFLNFYPENQLVFFRHNFFSNVENDSEESNDDSKFYIGTVHSAKGETHRSTLLVLDTKFKNFESGNEREFLMFDLLFEYLLGNYTDPDTIVDAAKKNETIKSLKLAYVALSRPTHLMVIAIPECFAENNTIARLNKGGWKNIEEKFSKVRQYI